MVHKILIAGCGGMSNVWFDYAIERSNTEIVGAVDIFEDNAKAMIQKKGLDIPTFSDLTTALAETEANLVFDVTIPASHKEVVITSLQAGCHVFGEKPMAESMIDAKRILQVTKQTGKTYSVMQNRRYTKEIRAFRECLAADTIGKVGAVHADFFLGPHFGGFRDEMEHPLIIDMAIHTFDQARFLSGADPVSVYCHEFNPHGSWYKGNASAVCIFEMSNGSVFHYNGSWCAEGLNTSWDSSWRVVGSKGTALWDGTNQLKAEVIDEAIPTEFMNQHQQIGLPITWKGKVGHLGCLDEMFLALEENRLAETDCSDNIKSMAMVFAAVESAKTNKKVEIGIC
ncbi:Gfo/Idh/MocA family protein [Halalkalibacter urbisdiaboli]|uniref:Gfo/Idh/MocA family protein n=1 Tax=Halalkalibacter urbisdiaboli TaxID=1960589 RepID=UPI001A98117A